MYVHACALSVFYLGVISDQTNDETNKSCAQSGKKPVVGL